MQFKTTILALATLITVSMAFPQAFTACPEDAQCSDEGKLRCHRFGHGTAVYECKHQCWGAREVCTVEGPCIDGKEPHCT